MANSQIYALSLSGKTAARHDYPSGLVQIHTGREARAQVTRGSTRDEWHVYSRGRLQLRTKTLRVAIAALDHAEMEG